MRTDTLLLQIATVLAQCIHRSPPAVKSAVVSAFRDLGFDIPTREFKHCPPSFEKIREVLDRLAGFFGERCRAAAISDELKLMPERDLQYVRRRLLHSTEASNRKIFNHAGRFNMGCGMWVSGVKPETPWAHNTDANREDDAEWRLRVKLARAFRWAARHNLSDDICSQFDTEVRKPRSRQLWDLIVPSWCSRSGKFHSIGSYEHTEGANDLQLLALGMRVQRQIQKYSMDAFAPDNMSNGIVVGISPTSCTVDWNETAPDGASSVVEYELRSRWSRYHNAYITTPIALYALIPGRHLRIPPGMPWREQWRAVTAASLQLVDSDGKALCDGCLVRSDDGQQAMASGAVIPGENAKLLYKAWVKSKHWQWRDHDASSSESEEEDYPGAATCRVRVYQPDGTATPVLLTRVNGARFAVGQVRRQLARKQGAGAINNPLLVTFFRTSSQEPLANTEAVAHGESLWMLTRQSEAARDLSACWLLKGTLGRCYLQNILTGGYLYSYRPWRLQYHPEDAFGGSSATCCTFQTDEVGCKRRPALVAASSAWHIVLHNHLHNWGASGGGTGGQRPGERDAEDADVSILRPGSVISLHRREGGLAVHVAARKRDGQLGLAVSPINDNPRAAHFEVVEGALSASAGGALCLRSCLHPSLFLTSSLPSFEVDLLDPGAAEMPTREETAEDEVAEFRELRQAGVPAMVVQAVMRAQVRADPLHVAFTDRQIWSAAQCPDPPQPPPMGAAQCLEVCRYLDAAASFCKWSGAHSERGYCCAGAWRSAYLMNCRATAYMVKRRDWDGLHLAMVRFREAVTAAACDCNHCSGIPRGPYPCGQITAVDAPTVWRPHQGELWGGWWNLRVYEQFPPSQAAEGCDDSGFHQQRQQYGW
jgi:hypothetical protein